MLLDNQMDLDSIWWIPDDQILIVAKTVNLDITWSITKLKICLLKMYAKGGQLNAETKLLVSLPEFDNIMLNFEYDNAKEQLTKIAVFSTIFNDLNLLLIIDEFLLNERIITFDGSNLHIRDLYTLDMYNTFELPVNIYKILKLMFVDDCIYFISTPYSPKFKSNILELWKLNMLADQLSDKPLLHWDKGCQRLYFIKHQCVTHDVDVLYYLKDGKTFSTNILLSSGRQAIKNLICLYDQGKVLDLDTMTSSDVARDIIGEYTNCKNIDIFLIDSLSGLTIVYDAVTNQKVCGIKRNTFIVSNATFGINCIYVISHSGSDDKYCIDIYDLTGQHCGVLVSPSNGEVEYIYYYRKQLIYLLRDGISKSLVYVNTQSKKIVTQTKVKFEYINFL